MKILKSCTKCHTEKEATLEFFRAQSKNKDGLKYICKSCDDQVQKERYLLKKPDYIAKVRKWQEANPTKLKLYKQRYTTKDSISE